MEIVFYYFIPENMQFTMKLSMNRVGTKNEYNFLWGEENEKRRANEICTI